MHPGWVRSGVRAPDGRSLVSCLPSGNPNSPTPPGNQPPRKPGDPMLLFTLQVAVAGVGWIAGHMIATRTPPPGEPTRR